MKNVCRIAVALASALLSEVGLASEVSRLASSAEPKYDALKRELRSFYPDECHGATKSDRVNASVKAIRAGMDAYAAAHPDYDALDLRRESYRLMRTHAEPVLFDNLPFYFELGVNGGWSLWDACVVPSRNVNRLCEKFYDEKGLIPAEARKLLSDRAGGRLLVCCGPFVDDMHHIPPFHSVLTKGFGGIRADVAAALAKCPADDRKGRKELEAALDGLDTIHAIQLSFAEAAKDKLKGKVEDKKTKFLCCGFGIGLSWGSVYFETENIVISDLVEI